METELMTLQEAYAKAGDDDIIKCNETEFVKQEIDGHTSIAWAGMHVE